MAGKRDLLSLINYGQDEIYRLLAAAIELKRRGRDAVEKQVLAGKNIALIFNKPSTRTRISFEAAVAHLGGHAIYLTQNELQLGRGETIEDTGRVLSRYVDAIVIRTYDHGDIERLASAAAVPVINALTDAHHPCQALADLMTILEKKERLRGVKLAYIGDGNNVCHSLLIGSAKMGLDFAAACPPGYKPNDEIVKAARVDEAGVNISIVDDPEEAARGADVLYTDVWTSMGQEGEADERHEAFAGFQINETLLEKAKPDAIVMHCLPAHRGEEISADVLDGPQSVVFDQAENRLHVQKALLMWLVGNGGGDA